MDECVCVDICDFFFLLNTGKGITCLCVSMNYECTLEVHPVAVLDGQELPEIVSCAWVIERVKNFCNVVGLSNEGYRSRCWHYLQLLKQVGRRVVCLVLEMFWQ